MCFPSPLVQFITSCNLNMVEVICVAIKLKSFFSVGPLGDLTFSSSLYWSKYFLCPFHIENVGCESYRSESMEGTGFIVHAWFILSPRQPLWLKLSLLPNQCIRSLAVAMMNFKKYIKKEAYFVFSKSHFMYI